MSLLEQTHAVELDQSVAKLSGGASSLQDMSIDQRLDLIAGCVHGVGEAAGDWVEAACEAKKIAATSPVRTEEILAGPIATVRFLRLLEQSLRDVRAAGAPRLAGPVRRRHGQCRVPVFPTRQLYDSLLFRPMTAETWLDPQVDPSAVCAESVSRLGGQHSPGKVIVVLGAGNVSSIPATDALTKILIENRAVALKMNPVNEYLSPFFETAFKPLVDANLLRLARGGVETGQHLIAHESTCGVHITGSIDSHDNIVWGVDAQREQRRRDNLPVLQKSITSELGNVSPWAIVPGKYSQSELRSQAQTIASSITNNVSFNCIATKLIITCRRWPQRQEFLALVDEALSTTPPRYAYYPGAADRFERFSGSQPEDPERLPWTLLRDMDPITSPHLLREESFTCVCAEMALDADSEVDFLYQAAESMNEQVWGTLAASFTLTRAGQRKHAAELDQCLRRLRYGTIGINQWPAVAFALMSPPWGGHPSSDLRDAQSGIGFVHNTYLLDRPEKTILRAPLTLSPKPIWLPSHRHPERVAWNLLNLYLRPSPLKLPRLIWSAITG